MSQKRIANYKITNKLIGKGSFGNVYLGINTLNNNSVAVKVIQRQRIQEHTLQYFDRQITALKNCVSDHIIKLYDIKKTVRHCYLFLEYCEQGDLAQYIKKKGKLRQQQALDFFFQIVRAFKVIIKNKLIHRDIKPANIFIKNGKIKIGDFGLSKFVCEQNMANTFAGSPFNMAPQVLKHHAYDNKADIYGIGTVLYQMLFGTPPFIGANIAELLQEINQKKMNNFDKKQISNETFNLLKKLLKIDPNSRMTWQQLFNYESKRMQKLKNKQLKKYQQFMKSISLRYTCAITSIFSLYNLKHNNNPEEQTGYSIKFLDQKLSTNLFLTLMQNTQIIQND